MLRLYELLMRLTNFLREREAGEMFSDLAIGPPAWLIAIIIGAVVLIIVGIVWLATTDWEDTDKK